MRIHKHFKIRRREIEITNWKNHKQELTEDFCGVCGYCGKHFIATLCDSQIDHFIPKKKYPDYKDKYNNLVLSCKVCNNKKKQDWPSNDPLKNITEDGKRGYIDPASEDFDNHLVRNDDGSISGKTDVGKYMVQRLGFNSRPIKEIFKIWILFEECKKLEERISKLDKNNNYKSAVDLLMELEKLRQKIHMSKE